MAYFHRFSNFVWTVENDSNTLRCTCGHVYFEKGGKNLRFQKYLDTCRTRPKHDIWSGLVLDHRKFGYRRAAEGLKPRWLILFRTKKLLKYPYPV